MEDILKNEDEEKELRKVRFRFIWCTTLILVPVSILLEGILNRFTYFSKFPVPMIGTAIVLLILPWTPWWQEFMRRDAGAVITFRKTLLSSAITIVIFMLYLFLRG